MNRYLKRLFCLVLLGHSSVGSSQVTIGPEGLQGLTSRSEEQIHQLEVHPAKEPRPALHYTFQIPVQQISHGNAVPFYYRAFSQLAEHSDEDRTRLFNLPDATTDVLTESEADKLIRSFDNVIESIRVATSREKCEWDWQVDRLEAVDAANFSLPELQQARRIALLLSVRTEWQIARRDYEGALETLRMSYKLATDTAESQTLISALVGIAISAIANHDVERLMASPDSPNLYWALAELPRPFIDLRESLRTEMVFQERAFAPLYQASTTSLTLDEWRDVYQEMGTLMGGLGFGPDAHIMNSVNATVILGYPRAKRHLINSGIDVEGMPVGKIVAIYQSQANREAMDELRKYCYLPFDLAHEPMAINTQRLNQSLLSELGSSSEVLPIARLLLPAILAARVAEVRLTAELNALQTIEAIRMHAATSSPPSLPSKLSDVEVVPIPRNPYTNKDFVYRLQDGTAELEYQILPRDFRGNDRTYHITLRSGYTK